MATWQLGYNTLNGNYNESVMKVQKLCSFTIKLRYSIKSDIAILSRDNLSSNRICRNKKFMISRHAALSSAQK